MAVYQKSTFSISFLLLFPLYFLSLSFCQGQDTASVILMNGQSVKGIIREDMGDYLKFEVMKKSRKKLVAIETENIFSVSLPGKAVHYYYAQDTTVGKDLTVSEMENYIMGEQAAMKYSRHRLNTGLAFVAGASGAWLGFWGLSIPVVYLTATGIPRPQLKESYPVDLSLRADEFFVAGFRDEARRMKVKRATTSAIGGLLLFWTIKVIAGGLN